MIPLLSSEWELDLFVPWSELEVQGEAQEKGSVFRHPAEYEGLRVRPLVRLLESHRENPYAASFVYLDDCWARGEWVRVFEQISSVGFVFTAQSFLEAVETCVAAKTGNKTLYENMLGFVGVGAETAQMLREYLPSKPRLSTTMPLPVLAPALVNLRRSETRTRFGFSVDDFVIGMRAEEGFEEFRCALDVLGYLLTSHRAGTRAYQLLCSVRNDGLRFAYGKLLSEYEIRYPGLSNHCRILDFESDSDLSAVSDAVLCLRPDMLEQIPSYIFSALSHQVPVLIASDSWEADLPSTVVARKPAGVDVDEWLRNQLLRLVEEPEYSKTLVDVIRHFVEEYHDARVVREDMLEILNFFKSKGQNSLRKRASEMQRFSNWHVSTVPFRLAKVFSERKVELGQQWEAFSSRLMTKALEDLFRGARR